MNLAAYASETYECDDKSTQKNQGIEALNISFKPVSLFMQLKAGGCYENEERGTSMGQWKIKEKWEQKRELEN